MQHNLPSPKEIFSYEPDHSCPHWDEIISEANDIMSKVNDALSVIQEAQEEIECMVDTIKDQAEAGRDINSSLRQWASDTNDEYENAIQLLEDAPEPDDYEARIEELEARIEELEDELAIATQSRIAWENLDVEVAQA